MWLGLLLASLSTAAVFFLCAPLASRLSADPIIVDHILSYIRWRAPGIFFFTAQFVLAGGLRGMRDTATPFKAALVSTLANVLGDVVLVYGFHAGVAGAAASTSISQGIGFAMLAAHTFGKRWLRAGDVLRVPRWSEVAPVLSTGVSLT